ncbi:hypothetical protein [uncultured Sphingomonas sp.]|uniref:hypothetical protein n=1 Tax=uncultured Sphingomonas sp. TaxID=158754 RepID=UPI0035CB0DF5
MNAPARFASDGNEDGAYTLESPATDAQGRSRQDGWTPKRQHTFLTALAEGHTVEQCCRFVGLTVSSAYALRRRAAGAAFALGWQAAALLARDTFADTLAARAIDGQTETITRPDGSEVTRHRYDNRLAMAMLTRLDKLAAAEGGERTHHAARLIASDWEAYLAGIERGGGPARAGLFLGARVSAAADVEAEGPDIGPLVALARADRFVRTGAAMLDELDVGDLDPADRAAWDAADWARAEAAGLVVLAAPPRAELAPAEPVRVAADTKAHGTPPLPPLPPRHDDRSGPIWWDDERGEWLTCFPVAEGAGWPDYEHGGPDDEEGDYERSLTPDERVALEAARAALLDDPLPDPHAERDAWFAGLAAAVAAAERGVEAEPGAERHYADLSFPRESGGPGAASDHPCDPGLPLSRENKRAEERADGPDVSAG